MKTPFAFQNPYFNLLFLFLFSVCSSSLRAATFFVSNLNSTGLGSISNAILMANGNAGLDDIRFIVAGTITLVTPLPTVTSPVFINGGSAPGYVVGGPPVISLNANSVGGNGLTLLPGSAGSTIQGLNIRGASANGIILIGSSNTSVQGCYIGTNLTGTAPAPNGARGIQVEANSNSVTIAGPNAGDGNLVSGNNQFGIVFVSCNNGLVAGNKIGTNAAGTAALGNREAGMQIFGTCNSITIGGNTANLRNIISGNGIPLTPRNGIEISAGPTQTTIIGNYIGLDITGTLPIGNNGGGIRIEGNSTNNIIGGLLPGQANEIGNNSAFGIGVMDAATTGNLISGNKIFCNTGKGIDLNSMGNANHPSPAILSVTAIGASGTATANDVVELYYDDNCASPPCQGETFISTINVNGTGVWNYAGAIDLTQTLVAVARDAANNTSEFTCTIVLPIDLSYFEVALNSDNIPVLQWSVIDESQVNVMQVQRRVGNTDFETIATLNGNGKINFDYQDKTVGNGIIQYRIESIDFAGVFFYSDVRTLTLDAKGPAYAVFPNPVSQYIQLTTQVEGDANVSLFDTQGKEIRNWNISVDSSSEKSVVKLNVSDLADGYYFLSVKRRGERVNIPVFVGN